MKDQGIFFFFFRDVSINYTPMGEGREIERDQRCGLRKNKAIHCCLVTLGRGGGGGGVNFETGCITLRGAWDMVNNLKKKKGGGGGGSLRPGSHHVNQYGFNLPPAICMCYADQPAIAGLSRQVSLGSRFFHPALSSSYLLVLRQ